MTQTRRNNKENLLPLSQSNRITLFPVIAPAKSHKRKRENDLDWVKPPSKKRKVMNEFELLGYKAIHYAKNIIHESSTLAALTDKTYISRLRDKIIDVRNREMTLVESVYLLLRYPLNPLWRYFERSIRYSKNHHIGNCFELAVLVLNYLRKHNVSAEIVEIVNSDHVFVIANRKGDLNDPSTWGDECYIYDPLNDMICPGKEIYSNVKKFHFDPSQVKPNILSPFEKSDKLFAIGKFECLRSTVENEKFYNEHLSILNSIKATCEIHLKLDEKKQLDYLFEDAKLTHVAIDSITNFELIRLFDKKLKHLIHAIEKTSAGESVLIEITKNFHSFYPSAWSYYTDLLSLPTLCNKIFDILEKDKLIYSDVSNSQWASYLNEVVAKENYHIAKILLAANVNPNIRSLTGCLPIITAIMQNNILMVQLIFSTANFDPHATNFDGLSALQAAAMVGNVEIVKLLLSNDFIKQHINYQQNRYHTALDYANEYNHKEIAEVLIQNGAKPSGNPTPSFLDDDVIMMIKEELQAILKKDDETSSQSVKPGL